MIANLVQRLVTYIVCL